MLHFSGRYVTLYYKKNISYLFFFYVLQEILMFALPLINIHRAKRWFSEMIQQEESPDPQCALNIKNSECAVCDETPIIPQEAKCRHIFCYYCLKVTYFLKNKNDSSLMINNLISSVLGQFSCRS